MQGTDNLLEDWPLGLKRAGYTCTHARLSGFQATASFASYGMHGQSI